MQSILKKIPAAILLVALALVPAQASDWERGVALYNKGDYRAALAEFQDLIADRPDAAGAWYYIGLCEYKLKRYDRVETPMARAIDLFEVQSPASPEIAGAWYTIGISHYLAGRFDKAIEPLKRYIELNARARREVDAAARAALGRAYYQLERFDEAEAALAAASGRAGAAEKSKDAAVNYYYLGAIYYKREDDDRAITALREAVRANPDETAALDLLAESLIRKAQKMKANANGLWLEAAEAGEKLRAVRDDEKTASVLGRAYFNARQFDKAIAPLEKIARAHPDNGQAWLYYGIALSRGGQMRRAMEALEMTIQLLPDSMAGLSELGYVYESDKQYQQALRIYEKAFAVTNDPAIQASIERVRVLAAQQP